MLKFGPRKVLYEKGFALSLIGYSYLQLGNIDQARFAFMRSINVFPKFRIGYLGLGTTYLISKEFGEAIKGC